LGQSHAHSIFALGQNAKCGTATLGCPLVTIRTDRDSQEWLSHKN
jgi:hypothetical protein